MPRLKVFRTAIGFHDALVAAPSRKAALAAWGADADLFARGVAEEVTNPALTAEPLARPGEVIRRLRGTAAEQLAALPPDRASGPSRPVRAEADDADDRPVRRRTTRPRAGRDAEGGPAPHPAARPGAGGRSAGERATPPPPPKPRPPKPDPAALDAAEDALAAAEKRARAALADLAERERRLARERRDLEADQAEERDRLTRERDAARRAYDAGMRARRGG